jgi:hypothetical protein
MSTNNKQGKLRLDLVDVYGKRLKGKVDVGLRHQVLSDTQVFNGLDASKKILITNLFATPQGLYRVEVDPGAYLPVSHFITIKASGITDTQIQLPVDPRKVKSVQFPDYATLPADMQKLLESSDKVLAFEGKKGEQLYDSLDDIRKACLLNIVAKCAATRLSNGKTVLPYIQKLNELRGERFFAVVSKELREETKNSTAEDLFRSVSGSLHKAPQGFSDAGSFKTFDRYGNLQLTFFANGNDWVADIDIDDAAGLGHIFQVLDHKLKDRHTHPYDIHEILVAQQKIDPGYHFEV